MNESTSPVPGNYFLNPGFIYLPAGPTVISAVVGSSVSVCIYDRKQKIGGMSLFQHPIVLDPRYSTARYGNAAVSALINMMVTRGSKPKHLEIQLLGGAYNAELSQENIGWENIQIAKKVIEKKKVRIVSEDVGGEKGRKIVFNISMNEVAVVKVDKIRKGDWYPY